MKRIFIISISAVLLSVVSGCTYWHQQGRSFDDCDRDLKLCHEQLEQYSDLYEVGFYEIEFIQDCMEQKGYTLVLEKDLPQFARRRDPQINSFWLLAGTSGTLDGQ